MEIVAAVPTLFLTQGVYGGVRVGFRSKWVSIGGFGLTGVVSVADTQPRFGYVIAPTLTVGTPGYFLNATFARGGFPAGNYDPNG